MSKPNQIDVMRGAGKIYEANDTVDDGRRNHRVRFWVDKENFYEVWLDGGALQIRAQPMGQQIHILPNVSNHVALNMELV